MTEEERRRLEQLRRDEQEQADELVRSWMSLPVSQRGASDDASGPGPLARPDGLSHTSMLVRSIREDAREVDWVASTASVDSYGTIIEQDWDGPHKGLDRYRSNPVVLWAHNSYALPIGRSTKVEVENPGKSTAALTTTVKFASAKANPMAEFCFQSVLEKTLRGMSVGWRGVWERREINGEMCDVAIHNVLYELSLCPIPSNPEALMRTAQRAFGSRIFSFPAPPEQRSAMPQTPPASAANKTPPAPEKKPMRTFIVNNIALDQIRRLGEAEIKEGDETIRVALPGLSEIEFKARASEERAAKLDLRVAELERDLTAANKRADDAKAAETKALDEKGKAETARDAAISERAKVELEPLTGLDPWQITPATRDHYARLAGTDPESYRNLVTEIREKGIKAGALTREIDRSKLPTNTPDPTPRATGTTPGTRSDDALFAQATAAAERRAQPTGPDTAAE